MTPIIPKYFRLPSLIAIGACLLLASGCKGENDHPPAAGRAAPVAPVVHQTPHEYWDVYKMQGAKIGYAHTAITKVPDQDLVQIASNTRLDVVRFGEATRQEMNITSLERPDGQVVSLTVTTSLGRKPETTSGRVTGNRLIMTMDAGEKRIEIPWSADTLGFFGVEQSLERAPLAPGEKRRLKVLVPVINQVGTIELHARGYEETEMLEGTQKLLRIDGVTELSEPPGAKIETILWTDAQGATLKTLTPAALQQESYRTTKAMALASGTGKTFDLGRDVIIKTKLIGNAHQARKIRYRVKVDGKDPREIFPNSRTQKLRSQGPNTAELTVQAVKPCPSASKDPPPPKEALDPGSIITSDDPEVISMARQAAGELADPCEIVLALERYVHEEVHEKNFSQALSTAAEVAKSHEGDCTEHAVLLAALARANKIPARVAMGLVYVRQLGGFGYHMWTEVYVGGTWTPLDATLGQGGIGPAHLKLTDSTLAGDSPYSSFLAVTSVLGRLKIDVLDVD